MLITGAGGGLGKAMAEAFAMRGASVAAVDLGAPDWCDGGNVTGFACDVADVEAVRRCAGDAARALGGIDVIVNNAGVSGIAPISQIDEMAWQRVMDVNVKGTFFVTQACLPFLSDSDGACVVNMSSQAGKRGEPFASHYSASKAAVIGLTKAMARELAPGVRVNCVCPGLVKTAMVVRAFTSQAAQHGVSVDEFERRARAEIPLARLQDAEDVANAVLFLSSPAARQITGEALNVSGGLVME